MADKTVSITVDADSLDDLSSHAHRATIFVGALLAAIVVYIVLKIALCVLAHRRQTAYNQDQKKAAFQKIASSRPCKLPSEKPKKKDSSVNSTRSKSSTKSTASQSKSAESKTSKSTKTSKKTTKTGKSSKLSSKTSKLSKKSTTKSASVSSEEKRLSGGADSYVVDETRTNSTTFDAAAFRPHIDSGVEEIAGGNDVMSQDQTGFVDYISQRERDQTEVLVELPEELPTEQEKEEEEQMVEQSAEDEAPSQDGSSHVPGTDSFGTSVESFTEHFEREEEAMDDARFPGSDSAFSVSEFSLAGSAIDQCRTRLPTSRASSTASAGRTSRSATGATSAAATCVVAAPARTRRATLGLICVPALCRRALGDVCRLSRSSSRGVCGCVSAGAAVLRACNVHGLLARALVSCRRCGCDVGEHCEMTHSHKLSVAKLAPVLAGEVAQLRSEPEQLQREKADAVAAMRSMAEYVEEQERRHKKEMDARGGGFPH